MPDGGGGASLEGFIGPASAAAGAGASGADGKAGIGSGVLSGSGSAAGAGAAATGSWAAGIGGGAEGRRVATHNVSKTLDANRAISQGRLVTSSTKVGCCFTSGKPQRLHFSSPAGTEALHLGLGQTMGDRIAVAAARVESRV